MAHIRDHITIGAPVDKVYELAHDPSRWATWFVGLGEAEKIEGDGSPGTTVEHHYLLAGMSFPLTSHVLEDEIRPDGSAHWKGDFQGPLSGWHVWDYRPTESGTEVFTETEYTVPGKALGQIADRLVIEKTQERSLHETLERMKLLAEASLQ